MSRIDTRTALTWGLPAVLTTIAVAWTVVAVGGILATQAHPAAAYSVAVLYDAVWLYALAQETVHRRQGSGGRLPQVLGWVFLALTVGVLAWHGALVGDPIAAVVGALIPALAKMTLLMATDADASRISRRAQVAIDTTRAAARDRIAVTRAVTAARRAELDAAARIEKGTRKAEAEAIITRGRAHQDYLDTIGRAPMPEGMPQGMPDRAGLLPALLSDGDLAALLAGGMPGPGMPEITAGGMGGSDAPDAGSDMIAGMGAADAEKDANGRAVAMLAAELYAADPPPSLTRFRRAMRQQMDARGLAGSWATIDGLYRRERALADGED